MTNLKKKYTAWEWRGIFFYLGVPFAMATMGVIYLVAGEKTYRRCLEELKNYGNPITKAVKGEK
jgi:hypothetical protein